MKKLSIGQICSGLLTGFLALILVCNLYTIAMKYFAGVQQPAVLGYSTAVVISGSMSGSIEVNDLVVIHRQKSYQTGDIITFESGEFLVTHRIVEETPEGFITKGDANNAEDTRPVPPEAVVGKVVLVIPGIGLAIEYLRTPLGMTCLVLVGFLMIEIPAMIDRRRNQEDGGSV